jgi:Protein of unknown function (DUF3093)
MWAAFGIAPALWAMLVQIILLVITSVTTALKISIDDTYLRIGRAKIEKIWIRQIVLLNQKEMALARGRQFDPAAYVEIRFWVNSGARLVLQDDRDPTPYWLISTKKGAAFSQALFGGN